MLPIHDDHIVLLLGLMDVFLNLCMLKLIVVMFVKIFDIYIRTYIIYV